MNFPKDSSIIYNLVATAMLHQVGALEYLQVVLSRTPNTPTTRSPIFSHKAERQKSLENRQIFAYSKDGFTACIPLKRNQLENY